MEEDPYSFEKKFQILDDVRKRVMMGDEELDQYLDHHNEKEFNELDEINEHDYVTFDLESPGVTKENEQSNGSNPQTNQIIENNGPIQDQKPQHLSLAKKNVQSDKINIMVCTMNCAGIIPKSYLELMPLFSAKIENFFPDVFIFGL